MAITLLPELCAYFCIKNNSERMTKVNAFALTENVFTKIQVDKAMKDFGFKQ